MAKEERIQEIRKLEKKLNQLRHTNLSQWESYGSELCAGAMINEEHKIEKQIEKLKDR